MKELVVVSGKGGTGKTSLVASYWALFESCIIVDCDVDAPDLHIILHPFIETKENFIGGKLARVRPGHCTACGKCEELCRFDAIAFDGPGNGVEQVTFRVDPLACEGCGVCAWFCSEKAIVLDPAVRGEWYRSTTSRGRMLHARLHPGAANSGKLVSRLREEARREADLRGDEVVLIDGSPGIGCPVIASVTGASLVLIVTEPTLSGEHDMQRVLALAQGLRIPSAVCVNRSDIDEGLAERIEQSAVLQGAAILPRVPFDRGVTEAQVRGEPVVNMSRSPAARAIEQGWQMLAGLLNLRKA